MKFLKYPLMFILLLLSFSAIADELLKREIVTKPIIQESLENHVKILASKEYAGRAADHEGLKLAAEYIIKEFKQAGIQPLPNSKSYLQELEVVNKMALHQDSTFKLLNTASSKSIPIALKRAAIVASKDIHLKELDIAFVGYGITKKNYDDYAGIDVKGKIVLMFRYEPEETGKRKYRPTKHATIKSKYELAIKNGVAGIIFINSPNGKITQKKDTFAVQRSLRLLKTNLSKIPMIHFEKSFINFIEEETKLTFSKIQEEMDNNKKPNSFLIKDLKMTMNVKAKINSFKTNNVIGYLPGNDPKLSKEAILIGGHYDHVGYGHFGSRLGKHGKNKLHPGADDNASGTAAIIEIAKILKKKQVSLKRSVLFALFTAEEMGLLGSNFMVKSEEIKNRNVVAMINFDMIGNYNSKQTLRVNGIKSSKTFKPLLEKVGTPNTKLSYSLYSPAIAPSDHQSFFKKGIPSMHFFTGFSKHYHSPTDTFDVVNFSGLNNIVSIVSGFVFNLSVFNEPIKLNTEQNYRPKASVRNIIFKRSKENLIRKVVKNSPEDKAGIKVGDILLEVDYIKVKTYGAYYSIMRDRATGEKIQLKIKRKISNKDEPKDDNQKKPEYKELEFIINL